MHKSSKHAYFIERENRDEVEKEVKKIRAILKDWVKNTSLTKEVAIFKNCRFLY